MKQHEKWLQGELEASDKHFPAPKSSHHGMGWEQRLLGFLALLGAAWESTLGPDKSGLTFLSLQK